MYTMLMGETGQLLYHPGTDDYTLAAPKMVRKLNSIATLTFTIYPNNPRYNSISLFTSRIKVYKDGTLQMIFRPIKCKRLFGGGKEYSCEELLGVIQNIKLRPNAWGANIRLGDRVAYATQMYNGSVSLYPDLNIYVGQAAVQNHTDVNLYDYEEKYAIKADFSQNLWDEWQNIIDSYKGEATVLVSYQDVAYGQRCMTLEGTYDLQNIPTVSTTTIEYGKNLDDLFAEVNVDDEFFTRLIPLGKDRAADSSYKRDGGDPKEPLDIYNATNKPDSSDPDYFSDQDYIDIKALKAIYGIIEATKTWEKVTNANTLVTKALEYLDTVDKAKIAETVTLTYWDLKAAGYNTEDINYLEYVRVINQPMGIDSTYLVTEETVSLAQPEKKSLTLGKPKKTLTDMNASSNKAAKNRADGLDNRVYILEN